MDSSASPMMINWRSAPAYFATKGIRFLVQEFIACTSITSTNLHFSSSLKVNSHISEIMEKHWTVTFTRTCHEFHV